MMGRYMHDNLMQPQLFIPAAQLENRLHHLFHVLGSIALWSVPATLAALWVCERKAASFSSNNQTSRNTTPSSLLGGHLQT